MDAATIYLIAYVATVAAFVAVLAGALPAGEPE